MNFFESVSNVSRAYNREWSLSYRKYAGKWKFYLRVGRLHFEYPTLPSIVEAYNAFVSVKYRIQVDSIVGFHGVLKELQTEGVDKITILGTEFDDTFVFVYQGKETVARFYVDPESWESVIREIRNGKRWATFPR